MAIIKVLSTKSAHNLIKYIGERNSQAHTENHTKYRNLVLRAHNIDLDYSKHYNAEYANSQFYAVRKMSNKLDKKTQAFHVIISFSNEDFPDVDNQKELEKQAKQAMQLVDDFMSKQLPNDVQRIVAIQRDGKGNKLHAHVAINSVCMNGKTLDTNILSLLQNKEEVKEKSQGLYTRFQQYMIDNFESVTNRDYMPIMRDNNVLRNSKIEQITNNNRYSWKQDLKYHIDNAINKAKSLTDFKNILQKHDITIKERNTTTDRVDENNKKVKRLAYTYSFIDKNKKQRKVRDYRINKRGVVRGLGKFATPQSIEKSIQNNISKREELNKQTQADLQKQSQEIAEKFADFGFDINDVINTSINNDNKDKKKIAAKVNKENEKFAAELINSINNDIKQQHNEISSYVRSFKQYEEDDEAEDEKEEKRLNSKEHINDEEQRKLAFERREKLLKELDDTETNTKQKQHENYIDLDEFD